MVAGRNNKETKEKRDSDMIKAVVMRKAESMLDRSFPYR